ncbi:MAG: InlB B-repeat-containing protein [Erysipelothrix sp.]
MKLKKTLLALLLSVSLLTPSVLSVSADESQKYLDAKLLGEDLNKTQQVSLNFDKPTNILVDAEGNNLEYLSTESSRYQLDSVDITRSRQKVEIEYYLGDYNSSALIGVDSGYADYEDYLSDFYLSISEINEKFGTSIPTSYRMVITSDYLGRIPEITNPEQPIKVKILVAEVLSFTLSAHKYQNKQDVLNPSAIGKTRTEIESWNEYWRVYRLSTQFKGIRGQEIDLKSAAQFGDKYKAGNREGELVEYGYYDPSGIFVEANTLTISDTLPKSITAAGFYNVDDYGSPVVKPSEASAVTSGAGVGFTGGTEGWKPKESSENYPIATQRDKLEAYQFNLNGDPFTNPEFDLWYPSANWMLGHPLQIQYNYNKISSLYTVDFDSNGGTTVDSISGINENTKINEPASPSKLGYTFAGWYKNNPLTEDVVESNRWNFENDLVYENMTLYANWIVDKVTVEYESNGGTMVPSETIDYNTKFTRPNDPIKNGYKFMGWYTDEVFSDIYDFSTLATRNIKLYAKWEKVENPAIEYTVIYEDGLFGEVFVSETYFVKEGSTTPKYSGELSREGYTFIGWSPRVSDSVTEDATYTAQWKKVDNPVQPTDPDTPKEPTTDPSDPGLKTEKLPTTGMHKDYRGLLFIVSGLLIVGITTLLRKKQNS